MWTCDLRESSRQKFAKPQIKSRKTLPSQILDTHEERHACCRQFQKLQRIFTTFKIFPCLGLATFSRGQNAKSGRLLLLSAHQPHDHFRRRLRGLACGRATFVNLLAKNSQSLKSRAEKRSLRKCLIHMKSAMRVASNFRSFNDAPRP
jgi:hypothetical protein